MNRIYKIVWNAARGCYVVASEIARTHQGKKSLKAGVLAAFAMAAAGGAVAHAAVTVADQAYSGSVVETAIAGTDGKKYEIANQQVSTDGTKALNRFNDFSLNQADIANLNLGEVAHQINVVNNKINIDGVVNAIKYGKIGGDVYFFSNKGIAVGATGVINVGRLTLGTNAMAGQVLFDGGYTAVAGNQVITIDRSGFFDMSLADQAAGLKDGGYWGASSTAESGAKISIAGQINAQDSILISLEKDVTLESTALLRTGAAFNVPSYTTADAYRNSIVNTANIQRATTATVTSDGIVLSAGGDVVSSGQVESHGRQIVMEANHDLTLQGGKILSDGGKIAMEADHDLTLQGGEILSDGGTIAMEANNNLTLQGSEILSDGGTIAMEANNNLTLQGSEVLSDGGKITMAVKNSTADLQADPEDPEHGGMLIIKAANISSKTDAGEGGDIELTSRRDAMGVTRVAIDDSTIDAGNTGNVTIHATTNTELYAWDIGDGAYAQVRLGKDSTTGNTITGKNVEIAARASTTGKVGDASATDAEGDEVTISDEENSILGFLDQYGLNFRSLASATKIYANADVDVEKTDISAMGTGENAGDIRIFSDARSVIQPFSLGLLNFGVNVGIGYVDSHVNVDNSHLYAKHDVDISATGDNIVSLNMIEFYLLDKVVQGTGANFSWAELHSDVSAKVGKDAVISSEGDTSLTATSTRTLASSVGNGGSGFSVGIAVGLSDTKAEAEMAGTVYANGEVSVKAENTLNTTSDPESEEKFYTPDTVTAEILAGDTNYKKVVGWGLDELTSAWEWLKAKVAGADKSGQMTKDLTNDSGDSGSSSQSKPWNKLGANAATSILLSENNATAAVTGKVRGLSSTRVDGKLTGSENAGAGKVTVSADTLSRTSNVATAARRSSTGDDGEKEQKENSVSAAVSYSLQRNHSEAYIAGDVKTTGDVTVHAETKIPYQNVWKDGSTMEQIFQGLKMVFGSTSTRFGLSELVDGWAQTQGVAENTSSAGSIAVVNYDNSAKAYIGKKVEDKTVPTVDAGGTVDVNGTTNITTVNFAGNVADALCETSPNLLVSPHISQYFNVDGWDMDKKARSGLGGAALAVRQQNTTEAYIDDGAVVTTGKDVKVNGTTEATNVAISAAGGNAQSVAIDATVGVQRIENGTKAYIGNATVTSSKNVNVSAKDTSMDLNLAGALAVSGSNTGIGASVAYNHIMRDTEAYISGGTIKADDNVSIQAENSGEIIAVAMAGGVTYDNKLAGVKNIAGSTGLHSSDESDEDGMELEDLVDGVSGEKSNLSASADSAIDEVAGKDGSMKGNAADAKGGLSIAANVSVNRIHDNAKAHVGVAGSASASSITADSLSVTSANDSAIRAVSGTVAASLNAGKSNSVAGSFMYNTITNTNEAYVEKAALTLSGNEETKDDKDIDESLTVSADNKASILNIAVSGSGATRGNAVAGQISLNWVDNVTNAHVKDSTVKANEAVTVSAADEGNIDSYTGAVAIAAGGTGTAVGASIAVNLIEGDTDANMENSTVEGFEGTASTKGGDVKVSAEEASNITVIVASATAADGFGGAFSGTGNWISTDTNAHVDNKKMNVSALTVDAANHSSATLGVGNAAVGNNAAGASIAVMVNDSDVTAYAKSTDAKADLLTISADNAYNGSASDSDSDTTAKTVAVGAAGGLSQFAGSGSVTVNVISQTTDAYLGAGTYDITNGNVTIDAKSTAKLFGFAGGLSLSLGGGVGAAVDVQTYNGHTYGYIGDGVTLTGAGKVHVNATSLEKLTSVAATIGGGADFGGAGAAGAHDIETDTKAFIGKEKDEGESSTTVDATKDVSLYAEDTTELSTGAGAGGIGGTAGVGLTAAVEVVNKKVAAFVGDGVKVTGAGGTGGVGSLSVKATNISDSGTFADGLGAGGTAGVAGAASETFVTHETDAYVGKNATVKATKGATIAADSYLSQDAHSGSVAGGGTVGVGLGNATVSFTGRTHAYTDEGATVDGGTKVALDASHVTNLTYATVAGAASGTVSVGGTVGVNVLDTETKAYISQGGKVSAGSAATTADGISVTALDTTKLNGGNGGLAIGFGGVGGGAAVGVTNIKKDTEAFVGDSAALETTGKTKLSAKNTEDLLNVTIQGSGGLYAGLAGAVNVMNLTSITKAYTGDRVTFNQTNQAGGDITVEADHTIEEMTSAVAGAAGGAGALGTAVDVANVKTQTNAYLGNNNIVHTDGTLSITAKDHMENILTTAVAAAAGGIGLSGSISVYNFGSTQSESDQALLSGTTDEEGHSSDVDTWASEEINKSQTSAALAAYDSGAMAGIKDKVATTFKSDTPEMGEKGTLAMVGGGTTVNAKSVNVTADDKLSVENITGNASVGAMAAGASVSVVSADTETQAKTGEKSVISASSDVNVSASSDHQMKSTIIGASISGGFSLQGTEQTWNDSSAVKTLIGESSRIVATGPVRITSANTRGLSSTLTGASVGLSGALNGALITATVGGRSDVVVDKKADVASKDALTLDADADTDLSALAIGASVGVYSGTGTGVDFDSHVKSKVAVLSGAALSGKTLSITATNTPMLKAEAVSAGLGLAGVGITKASLKSSDTSAVTVEGNAILTAEDKLTLHAIMDTPSDADKYNVYATAIAGGGGVVAGAVARSEIEMDQKTEVYIGNATIQAKTAELGAVHEDAVIGKIDSVSAGSVSGTGGETKTDITSDASVTIGAAEITTTEETKIFAENKTDREDKSGGQIANSVGAALANGNGVVNETTITHYTTVDIGKATVKANAADLTAEESAAGKTLYDKNAIAIEAHSTIISKDGSSLATGALVGAAHVKNTQSVTADTTTTVGEATLLAGDVDTANAKDKTGQYGSMASDYDGTYTGGSIAVGSRNDATIASDTLVDVFGAAGYAGSENNVTYHGQTNTNFAATAETAKGDISVMAGRDSDGNRGTISVNAHSDILNATAIPISVQKDPVATAHSTAALDVQAKANIRSDRDIHLKSNAGSVTALGSGEVKDWVNAVADAFGSEGSSIGKKDIDTSADVVMNGQAETGIHRKKSITIGGTDANGTWTTTVKSDGDISYSFGGSTAVGAELSARLAELRQKLVDFSDDPVAKATYEAEIQFLEEKMVAQGLGYYVTDTSGTTHFVELPPADTSELEKAEDSLQKANECIGNVQNAYDKAQTTLQAKKDAINNLGSLADDYSAKQTALSDAKETLGTKQTDKINAAGKMNAAETTLFLKMGNTSQTLDEYVAEHPTDADVIAYQNACETYKAAKDAFATAETAVTDAQTAVNDSATAYTAAVNTYNTTYADDFPTDPANYKAEEVDDRVNSINALSEMVKGLGTQLQANVTTLSNQVNATKAFFSGGGTEKGGKFYTQDGVEVTAVYSNGSVATVGTDGKLPDGAYYLLHRQDYALMAHNVTVGDITAQLGDIRFEGDNVSGSGTLLAHGDAEVNITNASPNNLQVGDVKVVGSQGTDGSGQGGTIFYNDVELKGNMTDAIKKANKDASKSVSFTVTTRDSEGSKAPSITILNTFQPSGYTRVEDGKTTTVPLYAASDTTLSGYIYNPRGHVTVSSKNGDVFTDGTIYAGTVDVKIDNGDYIQTYSPGSQSISNIGGAPLDDSGNKNSNLGSGILANGNIFISARYVNINSTIQSGVADWDLTIPETYKLYYENGADKVYQGSADWNPAGHTIRVEGASGQAVDKLSYDLDTGRFVVDGIEVHGGTVSIVGTIINTTNDTSKAAIKALDGYGQIVIDNQSGKDIELRTLSTGQGTEGKIEITDLDYETGQIISKTTYTRDGGLIKQSVQHYTDGEPSNDVTETSGETATYTPQKNKDGKDLYYTLQTGQDSSTTTTYELHETKMDWWGIQDKTPTSQDILNAGGTVTDHKTGDTHTLNGGAIITGSDRLSGTTATDQDGVQVSTQTYRTGLDTLSFTQKESRLWYTLGLAKKYDYKLVEKESNTTLKQYSVNAGYNIGIDFIGNETGGTLKVDGGSGNVIVNGTLSNGSGAATLSGASITQGARGYIDSGSLTMNAATGSAGTADAAIRTSAETVSGSAAKDFVVDVVNHGVTAGAITSGGVASLTADGDMSQMAETIVTANRVELTAGGAIGGDNAFVVKTTAQEGKDYGLKAAADGNISITNTGGDLYLDSVISRSGSVTLETNGSFVDNNYTDLNNEDAQQKLLAWANAAVLEGSGATMNKQKNLMIAKVESKYNEFQGLKAYVKDGVYTLDESTKATLQDQGIDVDAYIADKQARYDALKDNVGTWTSEGVNGYIDRVHNDTSSVYNNAAVTQADITGDDFLTVDEKAEILVGSAKSAKDLLVTFAPGSIKEGITDTKTTIKGTPHVQGASITLTTTGTDSGHTDIGQKTTGMEIDLSDPSKLTRDQVLALASAERGDFKIDGNMVTVSSVRPITAETTGIMNAIAKNGSIYLISEGGIASGSTFSAGKELRLKVSGDLNGVTIGTGSGENLILESGSGAITNTTITGGGILTARAKDGVDLKKSDGDLIVNTIYASDGDVTLDLAGENKNNSLLAEEREEGEETSYVNIEGKNITITNAKDMKGEDDKTTLGLRLTTPKEDDSVSGSIQATGSGSAKISLFGKSGSDATAIHSADLDLTLTKDASIASGLYKADNALSVNNQGTITGGTFEGKNTTLTNDGQVNAETGTPAPTFTATETLTVVNSADEAVTHSIIGATLKGKDVDVKNGKNARIDGSTFSATGTLSIENQGTITKSTLDGANIHVTNDETLEDGSYTTAGKLTITNKAAGSLVGGTFTGGNLELQNYGTVSGGEYRATADNFEGASSALKAYNEGTILDGIFTADVGDLEIENKDGEIFSSTYTATKGSLTVKDSSATEGVIKDSTITSYGKLTYTGTADADLKGTILTSGADDVEVTSEGRVNIDDAIAEEGNITIDSKGADETVIGTATSGKDITIKSGGDLTATTIDAGQKADLSAAGAMNVETLTAGTDAKMVADGNISITSGTAKKDLTITSNKASVEGTSLTATDGAATLTAAGSVTIHELLKSGTTSTVKANGGDLTAEAIEAGTDAEVEADGNITITTTAAANDLTITSHEGNIVGTTLTATGGSAALKADKGTMNITKLTAGKDAKAEGYGDITITDSKAADNLTVLSHNGSVDLTTAEATKGNADITAGQSVTIGELTTGAHTTVSALGGTLTANSIKANESATLYSKGFMDIENLEATKGNATLTTDDSMDVTNSQIGDVLTMKAAKNITVSQSNSVNKTIMEAGDTIQTKGEDANISSDEIEMTAGENILITDRSPVEKFTGVDLGEAAAVTSGSGDAGSLLNGEATGYDYDVTKKGSATLTARKGKADLTAKKLEVDTAIIGSDGTASPATLTMEVDNAAIDDLQSAADTLHVMIHGNTSDNTHYAGLHNSTDGSAIVKDSHIDHLNFTGNNDIGTENSTFAGDSLIQTEKVLVSLWKNPGNTTAESIGKIFIHDYDIASSEYFTRIRNGLTVNGERFPYTADSVMKRSLYGDNYIGKDGREKEEENTFYAKELRFGEVTDKESYRVVE